MTPPPPEGGAPPDRSRAPTEQMEIDVEEAARRAAAAARAREAARHAQTTHADELTGVLRDMIAAGMSMTDVADAVTDAGHRMTVRTVWHAVNRKKSATN